MLGLLTSSSLLVTVPSQCVEGCDVGVDVGNEVGKLVGFNVGVDVGEYVGEEVGKRVGFDVGFAVADIVGDVVGATVGVTGPKPSIQIWNPEPLKLSSVSKVIVVPASMHIFVPVVSKILPA